MDHTRIQFRIARNALKAIGVTIVDDTEWGQVIVFLTSDKSKESRHYYASDLDDAILTGLAMVSKVMRSTEQYRATVATMTGKVQ